MSKNNMKPAALQAQAQPRITKIDTVLGLLRQEGGADVTVISQATGWQAHSVRGAIAGHIKKKLGLTVITEKVAGRTVYRIEA